ncbi:hypothetical protein [Futiania mangrovi]|uniref:Uncharacterized protein n=1 Tax=Futiania mangrovi TaxID=2959716 RepID=A0A9J6PII1_9PROT|nr:hypothetical protein [Futiania mangrovii]MCP1335890.1 hypothetical protein [Futiania mangrovii]
MLGGLLLVLAIAAIYIVCFWLIANEGKPDEGAHGILALRTGAEVQARKEKRKPRKRGRAARQSQAAKP